MHVKQCLPLNGISVCQVSTSLTRAYISVAELLAVYTPPQVLSSLATGLVLGMPVSFRDI